MGVGKFRQIWTKVGKDGQVWMGQTDGQGWVTRVVGGCGYACRSRGWCGWVWASLGRYGQGWANVGRSGWFRLIDHGWVTWIVGGCGYACRSRSGCLGYGQVWEYKDKGGKMQAGLDRLD